MTEPIIPEDLEEIVREKKEFVRKKLSDRKKIDGIESKIKRDLNKWLGKPLSEAASRLESASSYQDARKRESLIDSTIAYLEGYITFVEEDVIADYLLTRALRPQNPRQPMFNFPESIPKAQEMVGRYVAKAQECIASARFQLAYADYLKDQLPAARTRLSDLRAYVADPDNRLDGRNRYLSNLMREVQTLENKCA